MVLGCFVRAVVRVFDSISVPRTAHRLCAESKWHGSAHVVDHFLRYHLGVYGAPVPLLFELRAEPVDAVDDYRLHFHAGGAVGVPDGCDPEVDVDILAVLVDVGVTGEGGGKFKVFG